MRICMLPELLLRVRSLIATDGQQNFLRVPQLPPFWGGGVGSPSNTKSLGPRPTSIPSGILIHAAIWPQRTWAENVGLCPFGGAGSPSNAMWPGPRPACMPSLILIHPTHVPFATIHQRDDRQNWTDNGPIR